MDLTARKMKILQAIISSYLETAEPVGSRTISKNYSLGISPATIRNEMADLEELGFIVQPHTSAGRIPSDRGYRFYVDTILEAQALEKQKIEFLEDLIDRADRIETLLKDVAKGLAQETQYTTLISSPKCNCSRVKSVQLISIEDNKLLVVVVTDNNAIKNHVIEIVEPIDQKILNRLMFVINEQLYGLSVEEINLPMIQNLENFAGVNAEIVNKVLSVIFETIKEIDDTDIYTSGTTNILKFPEFHNIDRAMELIGTLEEKDALIDILGSARVEIQNDKSHKPGTDLSIRIGDEIKIENMKDCSIITANYRIGTNQVGAIGIIGPKRMDYEHAITSIKDIIHKLEEKYHSSD